MSNRGRIARVALSALLVWTALPVSAKSQSVQLDVLVTITDLTNAPLAGIPARVSFGPSPGWRLPDAGTRFVTDAKGEYRFITRVVLEARQVKRPTNFVSSLISGKEHTRHLLVAAEMPYMQYHWLYVFDIDRFESDATCLMQGFTVLSPDARGAFTVEAKHDKQGGWSMPELKGLMMSRAPYEPSNFALQPATSNAGETHWTLNVAFRKSPDAVRR